MESNLARDVELVRLLVTEDMGRYLFAKSLLDRDSIQYMVKGEISRMSYGWEQPWFAEMPPEPVAFWVRSEDVERARRALRDLHEPVEGADSTGDA
jgi:hypothetical protein